MVNPESYVVRMCVNNNLLVFVVYKHIKMLLRVKNGSDVYQINFLERVFLEFCSHVFHMSFTLTLERSLKPSDNSMAVKCDLKMCYN